MNRRLPPRHTEWIDRSRPITFCFEGISYHGYHGDVLASALWANDVRMTGRSFKYHRPRGIYSLANHDVNVMVEDYGETGRTHMRGDVLPIEPNLDVHAVNTLGGLHRDWLRMTEWFSPFLPVGFYYKAFYTPRKLFPFYENQMRRIAGLGSIKPTKVYPPSPKDYAFCDLLVVGAGPAGLAAADAAADCGVRVMIVDEQPSAGGSLNWQWAGDPTATSHRQQLEAMVKKLQQTEHVDLRLGTQAAGRYGDHWIALCDCSRLTKLRAQAMVVAGGCFEQPAVFGNNDLPGCMLGSAAQRLIHLYAIKPFNRCVVLAANSDAYRMALDLREVGVDVAVLVDLRRNGEMTDLLQRVTEADIPVQNGHMVYEAIPAEGKWSIKGAVLCQLNDQNMPIPDTRKHINCDGIAVSVGWAPMSGLIAQSGGQYTYMQSVEQFVPNKLPKNVFAAGRGNGIYNLADQIADGHCAGLSAAQSLGHYDGPVPEPPSRRGPPPSHPYPIWTHKKKKNFVEFDEDLHLTDFTNAHQEGYDNIELMKRYTTVGMGPSQGKLANMNAVRILAQLNNQSIDQTGTTTWRPFHQPVSIAHLAGRRFHAQRHTPMHGWHAKSEAAFIHAGMWLRPEYYKLRHQKRDQTILNEALNVRHNVGMIDVGTLGKILAGGPDVVAFLERIYTGRFAKQPIGKLRYCLALDESGIIIDDGIIARLAEDRFYVTATTSGAAAFFREMQRWALIWNMNVTLTNATSHLAAMNIAGPHSRGVLAPCTDIDISPQAFGYSDVREGLVAGVPAIMMRVGFVGELGYEIHVPASYGHHVWSHLMGAGRTVEIRPFGVEAQRLLRLEKGHLIVSQDTDALTHPYEANMGWAIGKNKPFYIGQRSLAITRKQPLTRRLTGIQFATGQHGPLPLECHLIMDHNQIAGRITSIVHQSTLGYPLGLAYIRPDLAEEGTRVSIRVDDGTLVEAQVVPTPFYDPQNARQQ